VEFNKDINTITCRTWPRRETTLHILFFFPFFPICDRAPSQFLPLVRRRGVATRTTTSTVESRKDANASPGEIASCPETHSMNPPALSMPPWKLCPAGNVSQAPQFANMYYERRKGKYFGDGLEEYERISPNVYLCFVYSRDISRINPIRHMLLLLLRKREREFSKREEIYEQRTEFRQSNIYILDGCSLFLSPCDRWGNWNEVELGKNTRHVAFYPPPSFFYYFGNYPLLAYAHGNLPCY